MGEQYSQPAPDADSGAARAVFGERIDLARRYANLLSEEGEKRGLIGPREVDRLWDRHLLNCAVIENLVAPNASVVDLGSGAGLPGIPLAIARPDLTVTLLDPMQRRTQWLQFVADELNLPVRVVRGRAEDSESRAQCGRHDVVTARAVKPIGLLAEWARGLCVPGGSLVAIKGRSADQEVQRDDRALRRLRAKAEIRRCGEGVLQSPTTVIHVEYQTQVGQNPR